MPYPPFSRYETNESAQEPATTSSLPSRLRSTTRAVVHGAAAIPVREDTVIDMDPYCPHFPDFALLPRKTPHPFTMSSTPSPSKSATANGCWLLQSVTSCCIEPKSISV